MGDTSGKRRNTYGSAEILRAFNAVMSAAYYAAFIFSAGWMFVGDSTMFKKIIPDALMDRMDGYSRLAAAVLLACAVTAILMQDSVRLAVFDVVLIVTGYVSYLIGGHKHSYYVLCLLIVGATGRSYRKLLTLWTLVGSLIMAAAFFASQTGIIEDLVYRGTRHSYGIVYCTDCAAHVLFLMISYVMLRYRSFRVWDYAVLLIGLAFMWGTGGKTNIGGALLLIAGVLIGRLLRRVWIRRRIPGRIRKPAVKAAGALLCLSFPACAAFSFIATLRLKGLTESDSGLAAGDSLIYRFQMGARALAEHPVTLFGTKIKEHSFGGSTTHPDGWWENKYFFIDNSYLRLYLFGGVVLFCLFLLILTYAQVRCFLAGQYMFEYLLFIYALVCVLEHHLVDYSFQVFPLLAFSSGDILKRGVRKRPDRQSGAPPAG